MWRPIVTQIVTQPCRWVFTYRHQGRATTGCAACESTTERGTPALETQCPDPGMAASPDGLVSKCDPTLNPLALSSFAACASAWCVGGLRGNDTRIVTPGYRPVPLGWVRL